MDEVRVDEHQPCEVCRSRMGSLRWTIRHELRHAHRLTVQIQAEEVWACWGCYPQALYRRGLA